MSKPRERKSGIRNYGDVYLGVLTVSNLVADLIKLIN